MWFGLLEMVLPLTILLCMYIPNWILSTSTARDVVPERVSMPRAIMDVRWTQSEENYCRHLYSSTEGDSMRLGVPTKVGYVSHGSALSETIAHQAAAYLLCETTPEEDFALQNLTSVSSHFPPAFLTVLGLDELGTSGAFSYVDVVLACKNLLTLQEKLDEIESIALPSAREILSTSDPSDGAASLQAFFEGSDLDDVLNNLRWKRADILTADRAACEADCLGSTACLRSRLSDLVERFETVEEALEYARSHPDTLAAVVDLQPAGETSAGPEEYPYAMYLNAKKVPDLTEKYTNWAVDSFRGMDKWKDYYTAANIQNAIDNAIVKVYSGGAYSWNVLPRYSAYPVPAHINPFKAWISGLILPNILVFAFVPAVALQMQFIMYDYSQRLVRYTPLVEVNKVVYSALLCAVAFFPYVFLAAVVSLMLWYVYPLAATSLVFCVFGIWFVSLCLFNAMVATFCSNSALASIAAVVAYIIFWIPGLLACNILRRGSTWWLVVSIFPPSSLYTFGIILSYFEQLGVGLTWENVNANIVETSGAGFVSCEMLVVVILCSAFLLGLGVFIQDCGGLGRMWARARHSAAEPEIPGSDPKDLVLLQEDEAYIEKASERRVPAIEFHKITKFYGKMPVVKNFSMKVPQDTLTILLGHNGAGKTTLMSILSGVRSPSGGMLKIMGENLAGRKKTLKKSMGICHQLDFLWPTLTVMEHVTLVHRLKGQACRDTVREATSMLEDLSLHKSSSLQTMRLSGGEKRKLMLVLSFVGRPQIVLLDEPTAGMDLVSRRAAWHFLKTRVDRRCIFMTTHLMDEADALGDRIAIMSKGELLCYGSSMFLKRRYANGYRLLISGKASRMDDDFGRKIKRYFHEQSIPHLVSGKSIVLYLPQDRIREISSFLDSIWNRAKGQIAHRISLSCATLNDVFLRTLQKTSAQSKSSKSIKEVREDSRIESESTGLKGALLWNLLWKHRLNYFRSWLLMATSMIIPILFVAIGSLLLLVLETRRLSAGILLDDSYLGSPAKPLMFFGDDAVEMGILESVMAQRADIQVQPLTTAESTWQSYLLESSPEVNASCGDPSQSLTCASLILDESELRYQTLLTEEEKESTRSAYQFATSNTALHGIPAAINLLNNLLVLDHADGTGLRKIVTSLAPMEENEIGGWHTLAVIMNFTSVSILLAFCCVGASFGVSLTWERMHNCRIIQRVSGIMPFQYWLGHFTFDAMLYYSFCAAVILIVYSLPCRSFFVQPDAILALFLVFLASGPGVAHVSYILQGFFKNDFLCFGSLFAIRAFTGIVFLEVGISLTVLESHGHAGASKANSVLKWIIPILPEYNIARTFYDVIDSNFTGVDVSLANFEGKSLLLYVVYAIADSVLYPLIFWMLQCNLLDQAHSGKSCKTVQPLGEGGSTKTLRMEGVSFRYKHQSEERGLFNLNLKLHRKGVLGVLGPCGAGKSTLLKLLAGILHPGEGRISRIDGSAAGIVTGYCPQSGGLFPTMTVSEHMEFYSLVQKSRGQGRMDQVSLTKLGLTKYSGHQIRTLSEGNKKKLSLAIALNAHSPLAILDEPSFGVDPEGQIRICNCIRKASKSMSIVLCTHSIEECEALCSRIVVLSNGHLSGVQALDKMKGSCESGLRLRLKPSLAYTRQDMRTVFLKVFPGATLVDLESDWLESCIPGPRSELDKAGYFGGTFAKVQTLHAEGLISDFQLSEMGIEDVLLGGDGGE